MQKITGLIRSDGEFISFLSTLRSAFSSSERLPIAVNGLSGGAESAFICEAVRSAKELTGMPTLVICETDSERRRITDILLASGIRAVGYKKRDLVFHNIKASHDVDRERLSLLSSLMKSECEVVVTTASALQFRKKCSPNSPVR